jgi:hypothetical protein
MTAADDPIVFWLTMVLLVAGAIGWSLSALSHIRKALT